MKLTLLGAAVLLVAAAPTACKSSSTSGSTAAVDASAPAPASASASSAAKGPLAVPGATVAALPNMPFPERFAAEARGRPPGIKPTVEDVYAALGANGLTIVDQKQHLASPLGARYCVGARAVDKDTLLQISVCECSTPEVAQLARNYSTTTMETVIPFRTLYVNKQTLLVLREEKKTPEIDALVAKASAVFARL